MEYNKKQVKESSDHMNKKEELIIWSYFGDCRNTVDVDNIWDATQLAQIVEQAEPYNGKIKIENGDRKIPSSINKKGKYGENQISVNKQQKIGIIYNPNTDIHYFFDINMKDLSKDKNLSKTLKSTVRSR